jgi:F-type H+-transporting ATPase subunit epsilon
MTQIVPGEIAVRKNNQDFFLAVGEGFVEITGNSVSILTDMAIKAQDIDEAKAEEARKRAEERLQEKLTDDEVASVTAALAHSIAQLKVTRRQH